MSLTRRVLLELKYEGKDITQKIENSLLSFSVNDVANSAIDDVTISLEDKDHNWLNKFIVNEGDKIEMSAVSFNWNKPDEEYRVKFGTYFVDEPENSINPALFNLKGISIPGTGNFRELKRTKPWKNIKVKGVITSIASRYGFGVVYDTKLNPTIKELEQSNEADFEFLQKLCNDNGLIIKMYRSKMIIFNEAEYENKKPVLTIKPSDCEGQISFNRTLTDCNYDKAVLKYKKKKGVVITASYTRPGAKGDKTLNLTDSVDTQAEALNVCRTKLREKNKNAVKLSFTLPGLARIYASDVVKLEDVGQYNGLYYIDNKTQNFNPTSASFEAHKVLGY